MRTAAKTTVPIRLMATTNMGKAANPSQKDWAAYARDRIMALGLPFTSTDDLILYEQDLGLYTHFGPHKLLAEWLIHKQAVVAHVEKSVPANFKGLVSIDFETWAPEWSGNGETVKGTFLDHAWWCKDRPELQAPTFEAVAQAMYRQVAEAIRDRAPQARVSYWGFPHTYFGPVYDKPAPNAWRTMNDARAWMMAPPAGADMILVPLYASKTPVEEGTKIEHHHNQWHYSHMAVTKASDWREAVRLGKKFGKPVAANLFSRRERPLLPDSPDSERWLLMDARECKAIADAIKTDRPSEIVLWQFFDSKRRVDDDLDWFESVLLPELRIAGLVEPASS